MFRALVMAAALAAAAPAFALAAPAAAPTQDAAAADQARFERDRQAILAQAGQYRVRFAMHERVSFLDGYTPLEEDLSGGNEIVRVVYDDGDRISLQHILVMTHNDQTMVIKHWRQDWVYQPQTVLTYAGPNHWTLTAVPEDQRRGAWSQTVWQTDDSPRYGGVGRWTYDHGLTEWTSGPTWRPLARRDAVRHPIYDRYLGVNRHALTPAGWVHIQDNMKMGPAAAGEEPTAIVQEDVVNTYSRWDGYDAAPGDDYWAKTGDYWAAVRQAWDQAIARSNGVYLQEAANQGAVTGGPLMDWAEQIVEGEITTEAAIAEARALIAQATAEPTT
ncbi:MAG: hypothetical protein KF910_08795 [Brevundimonas sp.]|uniref:DUF6607 family protein n=1 Tax=Brevundimonas sp. TaxID=1871086 RepID=UPI0025BEF3E8|nr:DUF6607 family protein [Brevundimonas sp.]MBX3477692.1 hypothetical protein [Brevundimonas sp.]